MTQPARVLAAADVRRLLNYARHTRHPLRNRVLVLLSTRAGLRWSMVLRPGGRLDAQLLVARTIAKNDHERRVSLHHELRAALVQHHSACGRPRDGPVIRSERGAAMTANSIVNWFRSTYAELGLDGCSSHSGRRTFITRRSLRP